MRASTARLSLTLALMTAAAAITLVLGTIGLYGVMAYMVALRTREFGVRVALGADPQHLAPTVVDRGLTLIAGGVAAGSAVRSRGAVPAGVSLWRDAERSADAVRGDARARRHGVARELAPCEAGRAHRPGGRASVRLTAVQPGRRTDRTCARRSKPYLVLSAASFATRNARISSDMSSSLVHCSLYSVIGNRPRP